jgi:hypothetical protein
MGKRKSAPLVRVVFKDHSMSMHPHWHDGDLPDPPARGEGVCVAVGYLVHSCKEWLQVLHVTTTGQHGSYINIHRATVDSVERLVSKGRH